MKAHEKVTCHGCGKIIRFSDCLMFKQSMDGKKVKDTDQLLRGFACRDLMCLAKATGADEELPR